MWPQDEGCLGCAVARDAVDMKSGRRACKGQLNLSQRETPGSGNGLPQVPALPAALTVHTRASLQSLSSSISFLEMWVLIFIFNYCLRVLMRLCRYLARYLKYSSKVVFFINR